MSNDVRSTKRARQTSESEELVPPNKKHREILDKLCAAAQEVLRQNGLGPMLEAGFTVSIDPARYSQLVDHVPQLVSDMKSTAPALWTPQLPENLWECILDHVTRDRKEIFRALRVCKQWRHILRTSKTTKLNLFVAYCCFGDVTSLCIEFACALLRKRHADEVILWPFCAIPPGQEEEVCLSLQIPEPGISCTAQGEKGFCVINAKETNDHVHCLLHVKDGDFTCLNKWVILHDMAIERPGPMYDDSDPIPEPTPFKPRNMINETPERQQALMELVDWNAEVFFGAPRSTLPNKGEDGDMDVSGGDEV
jgi:hypothetical protein